MTHIILAIIYLAFISLGLPDSMLGAAWPDMYAAFGVPLSYAGIYSSIISAGTNYIESAELQTYIKVSFGSYGCNA